MTNAEQRIVPIPREWCEKVCRILRSNDDEFIQTTAQSGRDWFATFPDTWNYQRFEALACALDLEGICGRHIIDMEPPCDAYEFFFIFNSRKLLGKIGLLPDGKVIIVFSSHVPRKGESKL